MKKLIVATFVLTLAACGSEQTGTFDTEDGEGSYSVDTATGEASGSIETADGTVEFRSGANNPVKLPGRFSVYPGAKVVTNTTVNNGDGSGTMVILESDDAADEVVSFYRKQAEDAGVEIAMELTTAQGKMIAGESDSGTTFSLNANEQEGKTTVQLTVAEGMK